MPLFESIPYTNFHEHNLAWLIGQVKELTQLVQDFDGAVEEAVKKYIEEHPDVFPFVTPQMYGAKADGSEPETALIQRALDSGYDVFFPTDHGEVYLTDAVLTIPKGCHKLYGSGTWRGTTGTGVIKRVYSTSGLDTNASAIFKLADDQTGGLHIANLRVIGGTGSANSGIFLNAYSSDVVDKDIRLSNVALVDFTLGIKFLGRGLVCDGVSFGSCTNCVEAYYDGTDSYDSRAIWFNNCRFHSITGTAVNIKSGHAYGLKMEGCLADKAFHTLLASAEAAYHWSVCNNTVLSAYRASGASYLIDLAGAVGCVFANNHFRSVGTGSGKLYHFIYIHGGDDATGNVICDNIFDGSDQSAVRLTGNTSAIGNAICSNVFRNVGDSANSNYCAIQLSNTTNKGFTILGNNVADGGNNKRVLSAGSVTAISYSTVVGNIGSVPSTAYDNTCSVANNVTSIS